MNILLWIHEINEEIHVNRACDKKIKTNKKTFFTQKKTYLLKFPKHELYAKTEMIMLGQLCSVHKCAFLVVFG